MTKKTDRDAQAPFVMTDAIRLRSQALELTMRAAQVVPAFELKTAADLTKEAELLEQWLKGAK